MVFKVVQVTDTHLFATPDQAQKGVNTHRTLQAVLADVADRQRDCDLLLLTGDLSQDETPESYDRLKTLLAPFAHLPIHAIPGNHENLDHMRSRLAGDNIHVMTDAIVGNWRIAMLNSQVPGRVHGELGAAQLSRLDATLRDGAHHVMVAVHHPPVDIDSDWIDALRCVDGDELLAVVGGTSVKAVVCGHIHQVFEARVGDVRILTTPSTCVQFKPGSKDFAIDEEAAPGYRVFELERDGRWSTAVRRVIVQDHDSL